MHTFDGWDMALLILFVLALIASSMQYGRQRRQLAVTGSSLRFPELAISKFFYGISTLPPLIQLVDSN